MLASFEILLGINKQKNWLVISGLDDAVIPSENSLIIAEKIKNSWLVRINGAGHGLMYQYPEQFTGIVKTFFANTSRFN